MKSTFKKYLILLITLSCTIIFSSALEKYNKPNYKTTDSIITNNMLFDPNIRRDIYETHTINSSPYLEQNKVFKFNFESSSGKLEDFDKDKFSSIQVQLSFFAKELNDGYQEFYLYNNDKLFSKITNFELSKGFGKQSNFTRYELVFPEYFTDILEDDFIITIYLGANGFGKNDWIIDSLRIRLFYLYK